MSGNKVRQLGLGTDMRELRRRSGMSTRAVAERLGVSRMAVHRTESGKRTVPAEEVIAMCALYGVTGRDRERLVERATRGDNDASWLATGAAFSDQFRSFLALENRASRFTVSPTGGCPVFASGRGRSGVVLGAPRTRSYWWSIVA